MGSYDESSSGANSESGSSLAARRARLRGSLSRTAFPPDDGTAPETPDVEGVTTDSEVETQLANDTEEPTPAPAVEQTMTQFDPASAAGAGGPAKKAPGNATATAASPKATKEPAAKTAAPPSTSDNDEVSQYLSNSLFQSAQAIAPATTAKTASSALPAIPDQAVEALQHIDGALGACAVNLAALQRLSEEQTDVLKVLSSTLQNQTLFEIGLNLSSLTESLSAALEPMKAIGELIPAMDQLVSTLENREPDAQIGEKLSPDQLITSLADQLSAGLIDSWTFKCAYMAIYPSEHPADLLHRLVELLGTQRLSGDLFRAAYEAVQGAEAPARVPGRSRAANLEADLNGINDAEIRLRIDELQRANEDLQRRQEEREQELTSVLSQKEQELQEAQDMLNSRYDEFNSRYDEVADMLNKREDEYRALLESKDMELVEKESELNLLRAQMEELRNQTEEMVKDLQRQLSEVKTAKDESPDQQKSAAGSGYFDPAPRGQNMPQFEAASPKQQNAFFEGAQTSPGQSTQPSSSPQTIVQPMPAVQPSQTSSQQMQAVQPNQVPQAPTAGQVPPPNNNAVSASRNTTPQAQPTNFQANNGAGSYGSGVRAQVFEVIVRQALAGAPWREICSGPMQVNNISPDEVEAEVKRRQRLLN